MHTDGEQPYDCSAMVFYPLQYIDPHTRANIVRNVINEARRLHGQLTVVGVSERTIKLG